MKKMIEKAPYVCPESCLLVGSVITEWYKQSKGYSRSKIEVAFSDKLNEKLLEYYHVMSDVVKEVYDVFHDVVYHYKINIDIHFLDKETKDNSKGKIICWVYCDGELNEIIFEQCIS